MRTVAEAPAVLLLFSYRLQTYIVTSKPNRISAAEGLVHMMFSFLSIFYNSRKVFHIEKTIKVFYEFNTFATALITEAILPMSRNCSTV